MTSPQNRRYTIDPGPQGQYVRRGLRDYGLGRHVNQDPRSRRYVYRAAPASYGSVFHVRHIAVFDQGELGSCTGNAGLGILATGPYWEALTSTQQATGPGHGYTWDETGAVALYSDATEADGFPGDYPPDDTGSDGLTVAKLLTGDGIIPGYRHTFDLAGALAALQDFPLLVGTIWTDGMFDPDTRGRIAPTGRVAGGHEWIVDEFVPASRVPVGVPATVPAAVLSQRYDHIGGTTSWGDSFGIAGRFYMRTDDFGRLLAQDGDVIVLTPPNRPAPQPAPDPDAPPPAADPDRVLAQSMRTWLTAKGL